MKCEAKIVTWTDKEFQKPAVPEKATDGDEIGVKADPPKIQVKASMEPKL